MKQWIRDFFCLIFPHYCLGCQESMVSGEEILCTRCLVEIPRTYYHTHPEDNPMHKKFWGRINLRYAFAFVRYRKSGKVQTILHQLKYNRHPEISTFFGNIYGKELAESVDLGPFDLVVPVPLYISKERIRGYNQSDGFAKALAAHLEAEFNNRLLVRNQASSTQTRKSRSKRWKNVSEIFSVKYPKAIENKNILLVDDVVTTGATLEACAQRIMDCHPASLSVCTIAVAE